MPNWLIDLIEQHSTIVLFRHVFPDMDALGSQLGFSLWLKNRYPQKQIYCLGQNNSLSDKLGFQMDEVTEDVLKDSLGIILDTSNASRVDDQRFTLCKQTCRVDHHVQIESFCDQEWIDDHASATCEMLALYFDHIQASLPKKSAQLIYEGLIADNIRFTISTVREQTYDAAKYLYSQGVDVIEAERVNFNSSLLDYQYETLVRKHATVSNKFMYAIIDQKEYEEAGLTFSQAKEKVYVLSGIDEIEIWALFTQMEDGIHYSASLRSRTIPIRDVAVEYHGGGHECASGIKNLTLDQVHEIIDILSKRS